MFKIPCPLSLVPGKEGLHDLAVGKIGNRSLMKNRTRMKQDLADQIRISISIRVLGLSLTSCVLMLIINVLKGSSRCIAIMGKCFTNQYSVMFFLKKSYFFYKILVT